MEMSIVNKKAKLARNLSQAKKPIHPSLKGIKWVIFPTQTWARRWDILMMVVLTFYAFVIPYQFGISGGFLMKQPAWLALFVLANIIFLVDTFLPFFRAYRDKNGILIYNLKTIRSNYLRGRFLINLISSVPTTLLVIISKGAEEPFEVESSSLAGISVLDILKLIRFARYHRLTRRSDVANRMWENLPVGMTLVIKFIFLIILLSHWIACVWGAVAFFEAGSFDDFGERENWIKHWYYSSYVHGGINPIGKDNHLQRYMLCLFWAIQTLTSIGYGNISPITTAEFVVANVLMLIAGVFWAFVIGNLVDVATKFNTIANDYQDRMENANDMLEDFVTCIDKTGKIKESSTSCGGEFGTLISQPLDRRVRRHITDQRDRATNNHLDGRSAVALVEMYPTLEILSPELRKLSSLHLVGKYIEMIPYLSSKFLSPDDQAEIALNCVMMEFSAGETFSSHPIHGRGIIIVRQGCALTMRVFTQTVRNYQSHSDIFRVRADETECSVDSSEVLVEDSYLPERRLTTVFVGYTKVLFIPRSVIMDALAKNKEAWKESARWKYIRACVVLKFVVANWKAKASEAQTPTPQDAQV